MKASNSVLLLTVAAVASVLSWDIAAAGSSNSFSIPTSVFSGGGKDCSSDSFRMNGALGQTTPLMDPAAPSYSPSYANYPGFWYTLEAGLPGCDDTGAFAAAYGMLASDPEYGQACDFDQDGDVDGTDLSKMIDGS